MIVKQYYAIFMDTTSSMIQRVLTDDDAPVTTEQDESGVCELPTTVLDCVIAPVF